MNELLIAWENGLPLSKLIIITFITSPVWGGLIAYMYHRHVVKDDIEEILQKQERSNNKIIKEIV